MNFRGGNPGAVQFGNFINYYQFSPADDRVTLLPDHVWLPQGGLETQETPYLILDVGCSSGDMTQLLLNYLSQRISRKIHILGVDLDSTLIDKAKAANKYPQQIELACVDVMKNDEFSVIEKYLQSRNVDKFDAVCCFSVTMWIHLNHGDIGLREFLKKCSSIAKLFVVEPQRWESYKKAERRLKRSAKESFPSFSKLEWRMNVENEINNYIQNDLHRKNIHETARTTWKRKFSFYR